MLCYRRWVFWPFRDRIPTENKWPSLKEKIPFLNGEAQGTAQFAVVVEGVMETRRVVKMLPVSLTSLLVHLRRCNRLS